MVVSDARVLIRKKRVLWCIARLVSSCIDKRVINVFVYTLGRENKLVREHFDVFWSVFP